jgi:hypothetical protein
MTIPAVKAKSTYVVFVAEWNWLFSRNVLPRFVGRLGNPISETRDASNHTDDTQKREP